MDASRELVRLNRRIIDYFTYRSSNNARTSSAKWNLTLSITSTEFFPGNGFISRLSPLRNSTNTSVLTAPSITATSKIPSRERAGRMEYLVQISGKTSSRVLEIELPAAALEWSGYNCASPFLRPARQTSRVPLVAIAFVRKDQLLRIILTNDFQELSPILL
jgi:hypothetical protein